MKLVHSVLHVCVGVGWGVGGGGCWSLCVFLFV